MLCGLFLMSSCHIFLYHLLIIPKSTLLVAIISRAYSSDTIIRVQIRISYTGQSSFVQKQTEIYEMHPLFLDGKKSKQSTPILKRDRKAFNMRQRTELERQFQLIKYPSRHHRFSLARYLELSEFQVKVWFQNRRMKYKRRTSAMQQSDTNLSICYRNHVCNKA